MEGLNLRAIIKPDKSIEVCYSSPTSTAATAEEISKFKDSIKAAREKIKEKILARIATHGADEARFSSLKTELKNDCVLGTNNYCNDLTDLLVVLDNYKPPSTPSSNGGTPR